MCEVCLAVVWVVKVDLGVLNPCASLLDLRGNYTELIEKRNAADEVYEGNVSRVWGLDTRKKKSLNTFYIFRDTCSRLYHFIKCLEAYIHYVQWGNMNKDNINLVTHSPSTTNLCLYMWSITWVVVVSCIQEVTNNTIVMIITGVNRGSLRARYSPACIFCLCARQPSWMNEWVGTDINVVGPLQIPPGDDFSISESAHLFGKSTWRETIKRRRQRGATQCCVLDALSHCAFLWRAHK